MKDPRKLTLRAFLAAALISMSSIVAAEDDEGQTELDDDPIVEECVWYEWCYWF